MGAYATAKELGREAVLEKIKSAGLMTYGLRREDFCEALKQAEEAAPVDAGLNNADTDGALLELLRENPGRILGVEISRQPEFRGIGHAHGLSLRIECK